MTSRPVENARTAIRCARELGFALAGVAGVEPSAFAECYRAWLDAGKLGSMDYLARNVDIRLDPARLLDGARAVLMVADLYAARTDDADPPPGPGPGPGRGRVARYARGRDYHRVVKKRLHALADALRDRFPACDCRAFVDTAPVLERELAQRAGLGWTGKHTLTIHPRAGSYLVLGGLVTTLELAPPPDQEIVTDHCGSCTRCLDACPTDAITPYSVDASRCISYLTIERRAPIDPEFFAPIGDWLYGCDVCQEVCPHNSPRTERQLDPPLRAVRADYAPRRDAFDLLDVLGWDERRRRDAIAGTAMTRARLDMFRRNALIVAANQGAIDTEAIRRLAADDQEPELVRATARQIVERRAGER